jgi:hypothetical protein
MNTRTSNALLAVLCAAGMTSLAQAGNVVGYRKTTVPAGLSLYAPPFTTVGAGSAVGKLSAIRGDFQAGDTLQFLDSNLNKSAVYQWLTPAQGVPSNGWYDQGQNPVASTNLPQGGSFLLSTTGGVTVLSLGEVLSAPTPLSVPAGYTLVGNGTAKARPLNDIVFGGAIALGDTIQFIGSEGTPSAVYAWLTPVAGVPSNGWYDQDFNPMNPTLSSGCGFILSMRNGCTLTIPSPFN